VAQCRYQLRKGQPAPLSYISDRILSIPTSLNVWGRRFGDGGREHWWKSGSSNAYLLAWGMSMFTGGKFFWDLYHLV